MVLLALELAADRVIPTIVDLRLDLERLAFPRNQGRNVERDDPAIEDFAAVESGLGFKTVREENE